LLAKSTVTERERGRERAKVESKLLLGFLTLRPLGQQNGAWNKENAAPHPLPLEKHTMPRIPKYSYSSCGCWLRVYKYSRPKKRDTEPKIYAHLKTDKQGNQGVYVNNLIVQNHDQKEKTMPKNGFMSWPNKGKKKEVGFALLV